MIRLCITLVLATASVISAQNIDIRRIRVSPAMNQSIAGVFQVSHLDQLNQPHYAFNASEARTVCSSLRVSIASKAEVEEALARGLETCRFGWVDENLAVIPRINPLLNCGKNQTGVVTWQASVTQVFDVFCFNESDAAWQLKNPATDIPPISREPSTTVSPPTTHHASSSSLHQASSSVPTTADREAEPTRFVGTAQGSAGAKVILITSACALLLVAVIFTVYLKLQRGCSQGADVKQQQEYIETRQWECVRSSAETKKDAQEDEELEVGEDAN